MEITKTYNKTWQRWEWRNSRGHYHREDGPAIEWANGAEEWYRNDRLHREDGPAQIYDNGDKYWYRNGQRHRADGPAIECDNGSKYWFQNDRLHREGGPAIEFANGHKEYWVNGVKILSEEERRRVEKEKLEQEILRKENESNLI